MLYKKKIRANPLHPLYPCPVVQEMNPCSFFLSVVSVSYHSQMLMTYVFTEAEKPVGLPFANLLNLQINLCVTLFL